MTASASAHRMPGWLLLVGSMSALGPFSIDMYLPAFPTIGREMQEAGVEGTMAAFMLGIALGQLICGPLSDRFGRKPPLYVGLLLYALGSIGCSLASNMATLMLMRTVQALGACAPMSISRAIVRDRCEPHEAARAFSTLMLISSLGPMIAPALGGWVITVAGWRAVFVFQAVGASVLLVTMHFILAESRNPANVVPLALGSVLRGYGKLLMSRHFLGHTLVSAFSMGGIFCFVVGSPIVLIEAYALTPQQFGWLIGVNGIAFISASRLNMRALRNATPAQVLARAIWFPLLFGCVLVALAQFVRVPLWSVVLLQFGYFVSVGRTAPNVSALALAPHAQNAGAAAALMGSVQSGLGMLVGVSVGLLSNGTLTRLAALMTASALLAVVSYLWVRGAPHDAPH